MRGLGASLFIEAGQRSCGDSGEKIGAMRGGEAGRTTAMPPLKVMVMEAVMMNDGDDDDHNNR